MRGRRTARPSCRIHAVPQTRAHIVAGGGRAAHLKGDGTTVACGPIDDSRVIVWAPPMMTEPGVSFSPRRVAASYTLFGPLWECLQSSTRCSAPLMAQRSQGALAFSCTQLCLIRGVSVERFMLFSLPLQGCRQLRAVRLAMGAFVVIDAMFCITLGSTSHGGCWHSAARCYASLGEC